MKARTISLEEIANHRSFLEELCRTLLRPIIGILLRSGVPFATFAEIARSVYVEVASSEFGARGRKSNISRVAILTGLSRAQVRRERDRLDGVGEPDEEKPEERVRHASRMLLGWHTDPDFLDADGRPRTLEPGAHSFELLYERYSGKVVPPTAMLKELCQAGAVEQLPDGRLRVRSRSYMPAPTDRAALKRVSMAIADLAATASHNLFRSGTQRTRFERFATNQLIPAAAVGEFRAFLMVEGQTFLERVDNWLTKHEVSDGSDGSLVRIGAGVYQISP